MAKNYRVKRYYGKNGTTFRAKPRVLTVVILLLLFAGLVYAGTIIYKPVYDFVMDLGKEPPPKTESLPEPEPEAQPEPEPEPPPPSEPEYEKLRTLYIPPTTGAMSVDSIIEAISGTDINAVMIDIKNPAGEILFKTKNEMANEWGLVTQNAVDLRELATGLESKGIALVAKMSMFRDAKAASAGRRAYAINYQNSDYLWLDNSPENGGKPWLNPYSPLAQEYLSSLVDEALDAGVKMLVLENFQFPDNSAVYASFGADAESISRAEILKTTVSDYQKKAEGKGARVAVTFPVTAVTRTEGENNRYGGSILAVVDKYLLLDASPSQFGTGFSQNGLEIGNAKENPADAIKTAISYVKQGVASETEIIPMLEGELSEQTAVLKGLEYEEYFVRG